MTITATSAESRDDGTKATGSAVITVKPLAQLDVMLHAYVLTPDGGKWIAIDGENMDQYLLAESDAKYTGAGVSGGKIYATDETNYYMIAPSGNAYTVTQGDNFTDGKGFDFLYMLDSSYAPAITRDMVDQATGETVQKVAIGGTPVYISGSDSTGANYLILLKDYTTGEYQGASLDAGRGAAAIAYHDSLESNGYWFDRYYVLGADGMLEHYEVGYYLHNGEILNLGGWAVDYIPTGLEFADKEDVSMTYVESGDFQGIVISRLVQNGTELWCYDTQELSLRKMGMLNGVTDLVGLSVLTEDMGVTLPENPDDPGQSGNTSSDYVYGYVKTGSGLVWAKINTTTLAYQTVKEDATGYVAGTALDGKLWVATGVTKYGNTTYAFQELDPYNGYAMNSVSGDAAHTNGYSPADFAGVPSVSVTMVDSTNGATYTVTMGGYMIDAANGKYSSAKPMLFLVENYSSFVNADSEIYFPEKTFAANFAGIVYAGSELSEDGKLYYDYFLILDQSGNLYQLQMTNCLNNGKVVLNSTRSLTTLGKLEGTFNGGVSMSRVNADKVYISATTNSGVVFYSLDLDTYEAKSLGALGGAVSLVSLYSDAELTGDYTEKPVEPECQHTNTQIVDAKDATCAEDGHTGKTVCADCGETIDAGQVIPATGEHNYENGSCTECGAADPDYKPEEPETSEALIAYVTTEEGSVWVSIDVETLALTVLSEYSDVVYDGAGMGHDGMMYASADGKYVQIDTANDFAVTVGGDTAYGMAIKDGAPSAPAQELELVDTKNGETKTATVGGYMYYGAEDWGAPYTVKLLDFEANTTKEHSNYKYDDAMAEAMAFLSAEQVDASYFNEYYLVLAGNGNLYKHTEQTRFYGGTFGYQRSAELLAELELDVIYGASMTMLNETLALFSLNGEDSVVLYTYDLETEELTELGVMEGVTDLVGLTMPESEEEEEAEAANEVTGSTMTLVAANAKASEETEGEDITIADGNVTVNLRRDGTNGKLVITFDPTALTYKGMCSVSVFYSVNETEAADGKLILAYAAAQAVSVEEILATLNFEVVNPVTSTITVEQKENGDAASEEKEELTVEFPEEEVCTAQWKTISTTLSGNIGLNFYAELSDNLVNDPDTFVRFTFAGRTVDVPMADATVSEVNGTKQYRFTCPITAKNMTDGVTAQVMLGDIPVGNAKTMDVATYCNWVIENHAGNAKTVALMKAMLNYGASAQVLFDYRTDALANAALSDEDKVLADVDASEFAHNITGTEDGIKVNQMTLLLDSETTVRIYFELTGDKTIDQYTFLVDGKEVAPVEKNGLYYVQIPNISAHRLGRMYEITVGGITVTYGAMSYVNQVLNYADATPETVEMAKALFAYYQAAIAYKG